MAFVCFHIISPLFYVFPFVKRILEIEITNRFCFCFVSIKVSDKFKWRNLFIKSPFSGLWIDNLFSDWITERSCQERVHWRTVYGRFNCFCLFVGNLIPFFFLLFLIMYTVGLSSHSSKHQVVKAKLYLPSGLI